MSVMQPGGAKLSWAALLNNAVGDNAVITPAAGKIIRVHWVCFIPASTNTGDNLVTVKFGNGGRTLYINYVLAHREVLDGERNEPVVVSLDTDEPVAVTIHYQELN